MTQQQSIGATGIADHLSRPMPGMKTMKAQHTAEEMASAALRGEKLTAPRRHNEGRHARLTRGDGERNDIRH